MKRACAARLHRLGDQLKLAAAFVDGDASTNQYSEAVGGAEAQQAGLAAKEDDRKLRLTILQSEVDMSRRRRAAVGDLAFDPEIGVVGLDVLADVGDQRADAPDAALGRDGSDSDAGLALRASWSESDSRPR